MSDDKTKKSGLIDCAFSSFRWNDFVQRNYLIHTCANPENTGGIDANINGEKHWGRDYSCWHKNENMKYRCWSNSGKMKNCPMFKERLK